MTSQRARVKRGSKRAVYEREVINQILDDNLLCHVSFVVNGEPRIIPTAYIRRGDDIYLHGNRRNQMMTALLDGQTTAIAVTRLDGLVLARSGFHHSVNYQSVVLFGQAVEVEDKEPILDAFVDRLVPGRSADIRANTARELNATLVIRVPITDASAKIRSGDPVDDEEDYDTEIWAGTLPIVTRFGALEPCSRLRADAQVPANLTCYASPATIHE